MCSKSGNGFSKICLELLAAGADVNSVDKTNSSCLSWAAFNGHLETVQILIEHGEKRKENWRWADFPVQVRMLICAIRSTTLCCITLPELAEKCSSEFVFFDGFFFDCSLLFLDIF